MTMEVITLQGFKDACDAIKDPIFIYSTREQAGYNEFDVLKSNLIFRDVLIAKAPNRVCFKNGDSNMVINNVDHIRWKHGDDGSGDSLEFVCLAVSGDDRVNIVRDVVKFKCFKKQR